MYFHPVTRTWKDRGRAGQAKREKNQNPQETPKSEKDTPDPRSRVAQLMHSPVWEQYHYFGNSTTKLEKGKINHGKVVA